MDKSHIITIVALGPDSGELLTLAALSQMRMADALVLRTARHGAAEVLAREGIAYDTLDPLYEDCEDFDELCARAAQALVDRARGVRALCYAVSDPVSDATVRALARALPEDTGLRVLGGVTLADGAACAAIPFGVDTENLRVVTALSTRQLRVQADCPQVITELDNRYLASDVKLWLGDLFDDEMTVYFLENAAEPGAGARPILLCELDRQPRYDHRTAVLVPRVSVYERTRATYEDFLEVVARLRAPGGCPWDRAQTHLSDRRNFLEEAYEAAEAFDRDDPALMCEELGDMLMQVLFNIHIEEDAGRFTTDDVTDHICKKLIFRHPHVFGTAAADTSEEVLVNWEALKRQEKGQQTTADAMDAVARSLPALWRADKLQSKAAKAGFEFADVSGALDKLDEEMRELREAVERGTNFSEELGDVLFAAVKAGRFLNVDPEDALNATCEKFIARFRRVEEACAARGAELSSLPLDELTRLWNEAKHPTE